MKVFKFRNTVHTYVAKKKISFSAAPGNKASRTKIVCFNLFFQKLQMDPQRYTI